MIEFEGGYTLLFTSTEDDGRMFVILKSPDATYVVGEWIEDATIKPMSEHNTLQEAKKGRVWESPYG